MAVGKDSTDAEEDGAELLPDKITKLDKFKSTEDETAVPDELIGLPIDRGWAWVILFAAMFNVIIYGGLMKSFGVFFVEYMRQFDSSAAEIGLIMTVSNIVVSASGILVMNIGLTYMTARTSVCIGAILMSASYLIAAFAKTVAVLMVTLGAMAGVASTMIFLPILATIGVYFNKRRGLANSLSVAGASLGSLIFGPMYTTMFDYYGYTGTMLVTSGLILNILIAGVLLRPTEFYTKRNKSRTLQQTELQDMSKNADAIDTDDDLAGDQDTMAVNTDQQYTSKQYAFFDNDRETSNDRNHQPVAEIRERQMSESDSYPELTNKRLPTFAAIDFQRTRTISYNPDTSVNDAPPSPLLQRPRAGTNVSRRFRTMSEASNGSLHISDSKLVMYSAANIMCGSVASLAFNIKEDEHVITEARAIKESTTSDRNARKAIIKFLKKLFDVSLLREPVFIHFLFFAVVALPSAIMTSVYFIPYATDIGIDSQGVSILLIVIGCVDLVARVSVGFFADRKFVKPTTIVGVGFIVMAVANNCVRYVRTFNGILAFVIIQSCCSGLYMALYAVILVENVGIAKFKSALGFTSMFHGGSVAVVFPLSGSLRDTTGAYYWTYHFVSILLLIGAALAFTLPLTHARNQRKKQDENK